MRQRKLQEKYKRKQLEEDMEDFPQHYANTTENDKMTPLFMEEELKAILSGRQVRRLKDKYDGKGIRAKMFPYDLFPTIFWYRYKGSLTMPPCTEMVLWHVLDKPLKISQIQLKELADLLYSYQDEKTCELNTMATRKGDVFRPLQKQNMEEQNVTHCVEGTWTDWKYDEGKYR
uniref:carbonic anhydrase n=2 Tax=Corethron hystrix TaxID=216773 RepID=A0A7S1B9S9_9STRA|mmetsp:Transcript_18688/g.42690  ORF Transcript_18688/g.42690 Transcript_18688/m.42690 type:complete len:174 (+) Transcript_18688:54-575(+)